MQYLENVHFKEDQENTYKGKFILDKIHKSLKDKVLQEFNMKLFNKFDLFNQRFSKKFLKKLSREI